MITTKQKPIVDTRKESKHTTTENHQITKEERKRETKTIKQPENS